LRQKSIVEQYIISRKGAKPAKKNKDNFLRIFASLRLCERILFKAGLSGLGIGTGNPG
jgi:hypothetical protein